MNTGMPRFSVVIPAFNAERTIQATLQSLRAQTCRDFEAIVVDDGSTDATATRVEAVDDERISLMRLRNRGPSAARNVGIENARGGFVSFLDADDVWLPIYLERMADLLEANPRAGFAFTDAYTWHEEVRRFGRRTIMASSAPPRTMPHHARELFDLLVASNFVYTSTTLRRDVLDRTGGFDERLHRAEDWELWLRIAAHGYTAARAKIPLAVYRVQRGSLSSDTAALHAAGRRVFELVEREHPLDRERREHVRRRLARYPPAPPPPPPRSRLRKRIARALWLRRYRALPPKAVPRELVDLLAERQRRS
jgi:glycosyltransferase involved in cell wall biosynthesis